MARESQERPEVAEIVGRIEASRHELGAAVAKIQHALDVPSRIRHSVAKKPMAWFGGSMGVGLITSRLFRSKRTPKKVAKKGFLAFILTSVFGLLRPALEALILNEIQRRTRSHPRPGASQTETHLPLSKD